jgi:UDP-N-acetylglucosamine 2-epimerase
MWFIVGARARPNFMKISPIMDALRLYQRNCPDLFILIVHNGQRYDQNMSDGFFRDLYIPEPDINLEVGSGPHAEQTARIRVAFERVCLEKWDGRAAERIVAILLNSSSDDILGVVGMPNQPSHISATCYR